MYGTSLAVQWLGLHASTAGGTGLIPGRGTKIPQASWPGQKNKNKNNLKKYMFSVEILEKTEKHEEEKHTLYPNVQRIRCYYFAVYS